MKAGTKEHAEKYKESLDRWGKESLQKVLNYREWLKIKTHMPQKRIDDYIAENFSSHPKMLYDEWVRELKRPHANEGTSGS